MSNTMEEVTVVKSKHALFQFVVTVAGVVLGGLPSAAQTPPVITGAQGSTSAAFWFLGGVTPNCCPGLVNKYWTVYQLTLTTNTPNPSPSVQWFTDSPAKVRITPIGTAGATLTALGRSNPGSAFDIYVWVTVDGVSSARFPVFINTPWTQSHIGPSPDATCGSVFGIKFSNGWMGVVTNTLRDLAGNVRTPIDARETFENTRLLFFGSNWPTNLEEAAWPVGIWVGNTFKDTYAMCWGGVTAPTPPTVSWSPSGGTAIIRATQKYWIGSTGRFHGKCSQRHVVTCFTNHVSLSNITTPIVNDGLGGLCAPGQFAN